MSNASTVDKRVVRDSEYREGLQMKGKYPSDSGMSTAEYAIGTIAAAAFAAVLYTVVTGDSVLGGLTSLVQRALSVRF